MNVAQWLQIYFFATTALIVVPLGFEPLRDRFLAYGARAGRVRPPTSAGTGVSMRPRLDRLAGIRVPHSWFSHFYLFVLLLSAFWAVQWWTSGRLLRRVVTSNDDDDDNGVGMSADQVRLMWLLLVVQGARRCYESLAWTRPSAATMWIGHWVLSLAFYAAMSVAIWIEGRCKPSTPFRPRRPSSPWLNRVDGQRRCVRANLGGRPSEPRGRRGGR